MPKTHTPQNFTAGKSRKEMMLKNMTEQELKHIVAVNIKYLRAKFRYTIEEVSSMCDLSPKTIYNIEHEKTVVKLETIFTINECLGVPIEMFIDDERENNDQKNFSTASMALV